MEEKSRLDVLLTNSRPIVVYRERLAPPRLLNVTEFGRHTIRSQITDRRLPCYAAVMVETGHGQLVTEHSGSHAVAGPALFWLVPGALHGYGPDDGTSWAERWVLFDGALADECRALGLIDATSPLVPLADATEIGRLFGTLHSEMLDHSPLSRAAGAATLHRIIVTAAREQRRPMPAARGGADAALSALRERAFDEIDLAALADAFAISSATLRRRCLEAFGVPPKVLQTRIRLDRAKELLAVTDHSIEDVAATVGYDDSFYFSRIFGRYEGCSPSTFRSRNRR